MDGMEVVYRASGMTEAEIVKGYLEAEGFPVDLDYESAGPVVGSRWTVSAKSASASRRSMRRMRSWRSPGVRDRSGPSGLAPSGYREGTRTEARRLSTPRPHQGVPLSASVPYYFRAPRSPSALSTTAIAVALTMSRSSDCGCSSCTGFDMPIRIGPMTSAPPSRCSSL